MTTEFRGDARRFTARAGIYLAALAVVCSTALMGERWPRFALLSFAFFVPALVILHVLLRRFDRFTLDERTGELRYPGRPAVRFADILAVETHEVAGISSWTVATAKSRRKLLVAASPHRDDAIRDALESRAPGALFRRSNTTGLWLWLGLLLTPLLMQQGFLYWLQRRYPQASQPCIGTAWRTAARLSNAAVEIGPFVIAPPPSFQQRPVGDFVDSGGAVLRYELQDFSAEMSPAQVWLLRQGVGVRSLADAIVWAGCARRAVLPLAAKAVLLQDDRSRVIAFPSGAALVRDHHALIAVDSQDSTLAARITSPRTISDDLIEAVVAGVQKIQPGEP